MKAYRITDWHDRYEVTDKGAEAKPNTPPEKLKKGKLRYVRLSVWGHNVGPAWRKLTQKSYKKGVGTDLAAFGLFCKLLELAGDQERPYRGWILDHKQQPMDAAEIKDTIGVYDIDVVETCLDLLTDPEIDWVEYVECPLFWEAPENSGKPQTLIGDVPPTCREVPANITEPNLTNTETETENSSLSIFQLAYDHYPGTKRSAETEFDVLVNTHPDWETAIELLGPAVEKQITSRKILRSENKLVPEWKTLQNWLTGRCWEEVTEVDRREQAKLKRVQQQKVEHEQKKQTYLDDHRSFIEDCKPEVLTERCKRDPWLRWATEQIRPEVLETEAVG